MSTTDSAPPSYQQAVGLSPASASSSRPNQSNYVARNGIPPAIRRSMEDEGRPLPSGWVRQFDGQSSHHFYVDTNAKPPRSIWHHPYDDEKYLASLGTKEREHIMQLNHSPSKADIEAESTDEEGEKSYHKASHYASNLSHNGSGGQSMSSSSGKGKESLGQKMKDKLTGTTHTEREQTRAKRAKEEAQAYERHQAIRQAMTTAQQTGQPQLLGRDKDGHDLYLEPPGGPGSTNSGYPGSGGQQTGNQNPYIRHPAYSDPNARFIRPDYEYQRPYGYGYGGGYGMPMMMPMMMMGGLGGGLLMGGMMGGF